MDMGLQVQIGPVGKFSENKEEEKIFQINEI